MKRASAGVDSARPRRGALRLAVLLSAVPALHAHAFEVEHAEARYVNDRYEFEMTATLQAVPDQVESVLRDYERYPSLDGRILDARVLERPAPGVAVLATTLRACFGPFCRNVRRVEKVEEAPLLLTAITDASRSDVTFGETRTQLAQQPGGTRVTYRTSIVPAFWIPSLVGRRLMLRTLENATLDLFQNVERRAQSTSALASGAPHGDASG